MKAFGEQEDVLKTVKTFIAFKRRILAQVNWSLELPQACKNAQDDLCFLGHKFLTSTTGMI